MPSAASSAAWVCEDRVGERVYRFRPLPLGVAIRRGHIGPVMIFPAKCRIATRADSLRYAAPATIIPKEQTHEDLARQSELYHLYHAECG